jgi:hypothetical protein
MGSEAERIMAAEVLVAGSLRHPDDQMGAVAVEGQGQSSKVGRCRFTVSKPELKAHLVSALGTRMC